jgi:hypothetical protein
MDLHISDKQLRREVGVGATKGGETYNARSHFDDMIAGFVLLPAVDPHSQHSDGEILPTFARYGIEF